MREPMRRQVVEAIFSQFDQLDQNPPDHADDRWAIAAARTVLAMDAANLRAERQARAASGSSPEP